MTANARWMVAAAVSLWLAGCAREEPVETVCDAGCMFEPGGDNDPVLTRARATASTLTATDSVRVVLKNGTSYPWSVGLLTLRPLFEVGKTPYVPKSVETGDIKRIAADLGLTLGKDAWVVPELARGTSAALDITAAADATLYYVSVVNSSLSDNVHVVGGKVPVAPMNAAGTPNVVSLAGYTLFGGPGSTVVLGNKTVGAAPANSSVTVTDLSDCASGPLTAKQTFFRDDFTANANEPAWPYRPTYDGDFNGDWYTDGNTARYWNPNAGISGLPTSAPVVTGFIRFVDLCPGTNSTFSADSVVTTTYTAASDTTLLLYFFDRAGRVLEVVPNDTHRKAGTRRFGNYDYKIPSGTRRVAVVPAALIASGEKGTVAYEYLSADYEPAGAVTVTQLLADSFTSFGPSNFGSNQPTGWSDYGGDYYVHPSYNFVTLWNPAFNGGRADVDTGLFRTVTLTGRYVAGDTLSFKAFVATTFTDPTSFVRLRLEWKGVTAPNVQSDVMGQNWGTLLLRRFAIPAGATGVTVVIDGYLGARETSSFYADDVSVTANH